MSSIYPPGHIVGGRYRITSALSQGGMGAVYLAQQISLGRDVALKVMLERGNDPELTKRFDVEARAVCMLKHPNIITYHDYGRDEDGHPFLVMEFLGGYPGTKLIYGDKRASLRDLVHVVAQMCSALNEAHQKGIVHRDLKWSNIMVCPQSHDPYFSKLIDFGIMKVATDGSSGDQRQLTVTGMLLGTPEYMSPEAICGMPIDGRADQYSLAVMLWEALEGERPFQGATQFELLRQQVQEEPPPFETAKQLVADYPQLEGVVRTALEKHPDDRYQTILEFRDALLGAVMGTGKTSLGNQVLASPRRSTGQVAPRTGQPVPKSKRMSGVMPAAVDTAHRTAREAHATADPPQKSSKILMIVAALVLVVAGAAVAVLVTLAGQKKDDPAPTSVASTAAPDTLDAPADTVVAVATAPEVTNVGASVATATQPPTTTPPLADVVASAPETIAPFEDTVVAALTDQPDVASSPADVEAVVDVTSKKPESGPAKPVGEGTVRIQAQPWANVSVNGKPLGRTPQIYKGKAGQSVKITFEYAFGVGGKAVKTQTVKIKANETVNAYQVMRDED